MKRMSKSAIAKKMHSSTITGYHFTLTSMARIKKIHTQKKIMIM